MHLAGSDSLYGHAHYRGLARFFATLARRGARRLLKYTPHTMRTFDEGFVMVGGFSMLH